MTKVFYIKRELSIVLFIFLCISVRTVHASGTAAGTDITNKATVNYTVGSSSFVFTKDSNMTTLKVAEIINVTVTSQDGSTVKVNPGQSNAVTTFKVTNTGNGTEAFSLSVNTVVAGDDFDPALVSIYLDNASNGTVGSYDSGDTLYITGTNDPNLPADGSVTVFVLCNIPDTATGGHKGTLKLAAASRTGTGPAGTSLLGKGDGGSDAVIGLSGGSADATGIYEVAGIPSGTITINSDAEWTGKTAVTLNLSAMDDKGITGYYVSESSTRPVINDSGWQTVTSVAPYKADVPFTLSSGDGTKTVYAWYRDETGNISAIASDPIKLDTTPPVSSATPPGGTYTGTQNVALGCGDGSGIGCDKTYYTTDGTNPSTSSTIYSGPVAISVPTTLKFFSVDKLGNAEAVKTEIYQFVMPEIKGAADSFQSNQFTYRFDDISNDKIRNIPDSYHQVTVTFTNKKSDQLNEVVMVIAVPDDSSFCIDDSKTGVDRYVQFEEGGIPSGLLGVKSVLFSFDGGETYTGQEPEQDGNRCNDGVARLKIAMDGTFNGSDGSNDPYFKLKFIGYVK